jgi:4-amino-4-deoxy-L-arabinose transferase-like glycosyltransferase
MRQRIERINRLRQSLNWPAIPAWWGAVACLLLAAGCGSRFLVDGGLWNDEVSSILMAGGPTFMKWTPDPIAKIREIGRSQVSHPPGYGAVLALWTSVTGWTPFALRSLSLLFGLLAVALTYRIGREMVSPRAGVYAALVLSSSAYFVNYLHEVRLYAMLIFLITLMIWAYWRCVAAPRPPDWGPQVALFVGAVGIIYTHYYGAVVVIALGLYHLFFAPKNGRWWRVTVMMALAGLTFIPWLGYFRRGYDGYESNAALQAQSMNTRDTATQIPAVFANGSLPLIALVSAYALGTRRPRARIILFWAGAALALFIALNTARPYISLSRLRYALSLWPLLALVVAIGIDRLADARLRPEPVLLVWLALGLWQVRDLGFIRSLGTDGADPPDWDHLADVLMARERPGDAFVFITSPGDKVAVDYSLRDLKMPYVVVRWLLPPRDADIQQAAGLTTTAARMWVAYDAPPGYYPETVFEQTLRERFAYCGQGPGMNRFYLYEYRRLPDGPTIRFGEGLLPNGQVINMNVLEPPTLLENGPASLMLSWSAQRPLEPDTFFVRFRVLCKGEGEVMNEAYPLPAQTAMCQTYNFDVTPVAPDQCSITVTLEAWNAPLPGQWSSSSEPQNEFWLGSF